ncbi:asparagine--tRNA ligase [bacterium]|nr:asparagine--tRNA ligase [bacterium]
MKRTKIQALLRSDTPAQDVTIMGWIRFKRSSKNVVFLALNDGSCLANIQVICDPGVIDETIIKTISVGACVSVRGDLVASPAQGQNWEIHARDLTLFGTSPDDYPLQTKKHSFEFLRTIAHLRVRTNTFGAVFRIRNATAYAIHDFFFKRGFIYVHTPIITGSDCEGAGEMFRVTMLKPGQEPRTEAGTIDFSRDFFGKETNLTVSGQLEAELIAMGLSEVYTFGPTFRAENSNTTRHASEFWMIEPEMAFYDLRDTLDLARDFLKYITEFVLNTCAEDIAFLNERIDQTLRQRLEQIITTPFQVMTYTDAVAELVKAGRTFEYPVHWGMDLQSEHERYLTETVLEGPVFIIDFPKEIKAFYMRMNDDGKTVAAMDLLVPHIGEIIGGSQREERLDVLKKRLQDMGLPEKDYWWYLDIRKFGSAPHAGFGLGFERALMYLTGMANIRDVIPFPRTPGNAEF